MKIIYINYIDMNKIDAGSSVRPYQMYKAFVDLGYEVELVTGLTNRDNSEDRKKYLKNKLDIISKNDYDFCYIENMTSPLYKFYNKYEYEFIKQIYKLNIPIGVFYRDIYWKFDKEFGFKGIRSHILKYCQKKDLRFWKKYCRTIFLPTLKMNDYVKAKDVSILPPACNSYNVVDCHNLKNSVIYVGGISSNDYGFRDLIDCFRIVNKSINTRLILVCREFEYDVQKEYLNHEDFEWLDVRHISGKKLDEAYLEADFAIAPLKKITYNDFCMPIKIFEYIAHSKPIVCTNCDEISALVQNNKLGIVVNDNASDLADAVKSMYAADNIRTLSNNIYQFSKCNRWIDRASKVHECLCENK